MEQKKQKIDDVKMSQLSQFKKAKVVDDDIGDDDIGVKRMQHLPPHPISSDNVITFPIPNRLDTLRMATRRANIVQLLTGRGYLNIGRPLTLLELQAAYNIYTQLYPTDYDITQDDFNNIVSFSIGGKTRRRKKRVYSYKKTKRSTNKKRAKSMKRKRS